MQPWLVTQWSVTLEQLRDAKACVEGYNRVVCMLSDIPFDEAYHNETFEVYIHTDFTVHHRDPINLIDIVNNNGVLDAIWATRCIPRCTNGVDHDLRMFAIWCAQQGQHLLSDQRIIAALDTAIRYADGYVTVDDLKVAYLVADQAGNDGWLCFGDIDLDDPHARLARAKCHAHHTAIRASSTEPPCIASFGVAQSYIKTARYEHGRMKQAIADMADMFIKMCNGEAPWQRGIPCGQ